MDSLTTNMRQDTTHHRGSALLESILGIALLSLFLLILVGNISYAEIRSLQNTMRTRALLSAEEGLEATRSIRDNNYVLLVAGTHGLARTNGYWEFSGAGDTANDLRREIVLTPLDGSTTEAVAHVTWGDTEHLGEVSLRTRLTDWKTP